MKKTPRKRPREVRIAELKANLSKHLRAAQRGHTLTVLDRDTPIAMIVPFQRDVLIARKANGRRLRDIVLPPPVKLDVDVLELLRQEREDRF